jgi:HEAT repeat protein
MSWFRRLVGRGDDRVPGVGDDLLDGLRHPDPDVRAAGVRRCGSARLEAAIPLLAERLLDPHPQVRGAAAGALGRIGGARAADALLRAARTRRLAGGRLARELARGAPDHYLEPALQRPENRGVRPVLALAAGLRGRSDEIGPLLIEMAGGSEEERAAAYHVLGGLGDEHVVPLLIDALFDPSSRVQRSARRALQRLGALAPGAPASHGGPAPGPARRRRLPWAGRARRSLT